VKYEKLQWVGLLAKMEEIRHNRNIEKLFGIQQLEVWNGMENLI
jgi:hypothetical protein